MKIKIGRRYKTAKGEKVTVTGVVWRKNVATYCCSDEVDRNAEGKAILNSHPSEFVASKHHFVEACGG